MPPRHLLTIAVEEFCDDPALAAIVSPTHRQRFEPRVEADVAALLALLAEHCATAVFCVPEGVATRHPTMLERIAAAGHDVVARTAAMPSATAERRLWRVRPLGTGAALRRRAWPDLQRRLRARAAQGSLVLAIASWEIDATQPVVRGAGGRTVAAHYEGLAQFRERLAWCLREFPFVASGHGVGLAVARLPKEATAPEQIPELPPAGPPRRDGALPRVSLVVPLLDEAEGLPYLLRTLRLLQDRFADRWQFEFVLVDDGSSDATWTLLQQAAAGQPHFVLARHEHNRGVAAAIQTGIRRATADVVASIDGDCSYDPAEIEHMLPLLADADLVTASPYHPRGAVANVPAWRLWLSRGLSRIYRVLLRRNIHTWTSCFRVYRRDVVLGVPLENERFLGIAELLIRLVRRGARIVEHPAVLESRLLGFSKMKTLRTIRGHLRLCWRVFRGQVR